MVVCVVAVANTITVAVCAVVVGTILVFIIAVAAALCPRSGSFGGTAHVMASGKRGVRRIKGH